MDPNTSAKHLQLRIKARHLETALAEEPGCATTTSPRLRGSSRRSAATSPHYSPRRPDVTGPRTRPGGGSLVSDPADLARENRELHRLREQVKAHDGDTCAEVEKALEDMEDDLNELVIILARAESREGFWTPTASLRHLIAERDELRAAVAMKTYEIEQLTRALDRTRPLRDLESAVKFYLDDGYDEYERVTRLHEAVEKLSQALGDAS